MPTAAKTNGSKRSQLLNIWTYWLKQNEVFSGTTIFFPVKTRSKNMRKHSKTVSMARAISLEPKLAIVSVEIPAL
jgi:hypothetical protein